MYETIEDGTVVGCRQDSSTMWIIFAPKSLNPDRHGSNVVGMEPPSPEEEIRWAETCGNRFGEGPPNPGGFFCNGAYRNEADEAAALARWRKRTGR